jgi:hypothetical protein
MMPAPFQTPRYSPSIPSRACNVNWIQCTKPSTKLMRKVLDPDPDSDVINKLGDIASEVGVYKRRPGRYRSRVL